MVSPVETHWEVSSWDYLCASYLEFGISGGTKQLLPLIVTPIHIGSAAKLIATTLAVAILNTPHIDLEVCSPVALLVIVKVVFVVENFVGLPIGTVGHTRCRNCNQQQS